MAKRFTAIFILAALAFSCEPRTHTCECESYDTNTGETKTYSREIEGSRNDAEWECSTTSSPNPDIWISNCTLRSDSYLR